MKIPFIALILQGIPEQIAIVTFAFVIAKIKFDWKKIFVIGIMLALTSYIVRQFPITFGIHTILMIGLLFVLLVALAKANINTAIIASLLSFLAIIVSETVCLALLMPLFGVTSDMFFSNVTIRILITLPQVSVMFIFAFIIYKFINRKAMKI